MSGDVLYLGRFLSGIFCNGTFFSCTVWRILLISKVNIKEGVVTGYVLSLKIRHHPDLSDSLRVFP
jgi:hypothetical protein